MTNVLELRGITKRFPGVLANDKIDITLREGKILALLGENGAGKSTLMNILYGLYKPDEGTITVRGKEAEISRSERCHCSGHRHGASAFYACAGDDRHRECDARHRTHQERYLP